jgi:putative Mn2+ efflux pump MntP
MWSLILGSFTLSVIHALIPNHWIPLIAIAKAEGWKTRESMFATFITAFFHLLSTILIGILIGIAGVRLFEQFESISHIVAPTLLVILGIIYLILDFSHSGHKHLHDIKLKNKKSKAGIITSLAIGMFFSPCVELEAYYFQAASAGTLGIVVVSAVYMIITLGCIMGLVYLGLKGINRFNSHFMEHHAKRITGLVLILLGFIGYFIDL